MRNCLFFNFEDMTQGLEGGRYFPYEGGGVELDDFYASLCAPVEPDVSSETVTGSDKDSFGVRKEVGGDLLNILQQ